MTFFSEAPPCVRSHCCQSPETESELKRGAESKKKKDMQKQNKGAKEKTKQNKGDQRNAPQRGKRWTGEK